MGQTMKKAGQVCSGGEPVKPGQVQPQKANAAAKQLIINKGKFADKYVLTSEVCGDGMNGWVMVAEGKRGTPVAKKKFAIKVFEKKKAMNRDVYQNEMTIFYEMDHPHVARLVDVFEDQTKMHIVMEHLAGGDLFERAKTKAAQGKYSEELAVSEMKQMLSAVAYLHSRKPMIIHRDLKPENFVYDQKDGEHLKLIDFGLSHQWDKDKESAMSKVCGTGMYMAMEVARGSYTEKCDLFSLGIINYVLLTGHAPDRMEKNDRKPLAPQAFGREHFQQRSKEAQDFVKLLVNEDPSQRPSADAALEDPWIKTGARDATPISVEVLGSLRNFTVAQGFRKAALNMMAWSLSSEDRQKLRPEFEKLDTNKNGKIKLKEVKKVLDSQFDMKADKFQDLFKDFENSDGEDEISYSDFLGAVMQGRVQNHLGALWAAFDRFDVQNKGVLTSEGLKQVFGDKCDGENIDDIISQIAKDGNGEITRAAFIEYMTADTDAAADAAGKAIDHEMNQPICKKTAASWAPGTGNQTAKDLIFQPLQKKTRLGTGAAAPAGSAKGPASWTPGK